MKFDYLNTERWKTNHFRIWHTSTFIFGFSFWFLHIRSLSTGFNCNLDLWTPCVKESTKQTSVPVISCFSFKIFSIYSSQFFIRIRILSLWRQNEIVLSLRSWKRIAYIWLCLLKTKLILFVCSHPLIRHFSWNKTRCWVFSSTPSVIQYFTKTKTILNSVYSTLSLI